jgi:hypothetical protein
MLISSDWINRTSNFCHPKIKISPKTFQTFELWGNQRSKKLKKNWNTASPDALAVVGRVVVVDAS